MIILKVLEEIIKVELSIYGNYITCKLVMCRESLPYKNIIN